MAKKGSGLQNRLRTLRFEHGEMTQQALAEEAGVTRQTIIALEANRYSPSLVLGFKLARVFGVGIEYVFRFVETTEKRSKGGGTGRARKKRK